MLSEMKEYENTTVFGTSEAKQNKLNSKELGDNEPHVVLNVQNFCMEMCAKKNVLSGG